MKTIYTATEIAAFLLEADFPLSLERDILHQLWLRKEIRQEDMSAFYKEVYQEMEKQTLRQDFEEVNLLLQHTGSSFLLDQDTEEKNLVEVYFKTIKLFLSYAPQVTYKKIKLRTLLKEFGYKRRSTLLLQTIHEVLSTLELHAYFRGNCPCNLSEASLEDMIIFRLH